MEVDIDLVEGYKTSIFDKTVKQVMPYFTAIKTLCIFYSTGKYTLLLSCFERMVFLKQYHIYGKAQDVACEGKSILTKTY